MQPNRLWLGWRCHVKGGGLALSEIGELYARYSPDIDNEMRLGYNYDGYQCGKRVLSCDPNGELQMQTEEGCYSGSAGMQLSYLLSA